MIFERSKDGILDVKEGIIAHQVNCCNTIGAGVSRAIITRYPKVEGAYHEMCNKKGKDGAFGMIQTIRVGENLVIANIFSQKDFGNSKKTGIVYTDMNLLTESLKYLLKTNSKVYVPQYIGCGLAGGDWHEFLKLMKDTDIHIRGLEKEEK